MKLNKWMFGLVLALVLCLCASVAMAATTHMVSTADELKTAVENAENGDTILFTANITTSATLTFNGTNASEITIDGDSFTLTSTANRAIDVTSDATNAVVTIEDLNIACNGQRGINYNSTGTLTLNNVNVSGSSTYAINLPGSSDGCTVEINGGSYAGCIALNVWGENASIIATNADFKCSVNSAVEGYSAVNLNNDAVANE